MDIEVFETYPSALNKKVLLSDYYKNDLIEFESIVSKALALFDLKLKLTPSSWHQMDAVLALLSGLRYQQGKQLVFGNIEEGQIII